MLFRLKGGKHVQDKKEYTKGDIIDTSRDLCSMFKNKFERVHEDLEDTGKEVVDKFKKPNITPPAKDEDKAQAPAKSSSTAKKTTKKADKKTEDGSEYGIDVTSDYPTAAEVEVKVFEKSKWYTIIDEADGEVLNEKKLRKKDIKDFLEQYLGNDDDSDEDDDSEDDSEE